jgi:hypothetical protein
MMFVFLMACLSVAIADHGGGMISTTIVSADKMTVDQTRARSINDGVMYATMYDGEKSCMTLKIDDETVAKSAIVSIKEARITSCKSSGDCKTLDMVHNGELNGDMVKFAAGRIEVRTGETELCFVPPFGITDNTISVEWEIVRKPEARRRLQRDVIEVEDIEDIFDLAAWCLSLGNCTGVFVIQTPIVCIEGMVFDEVLGRCVLIDEEFERGLLWAWLPISFVVLLVIIGIAACMAWPASTETIKVSHFN